MRVVGYVRVSTEEQASEGVSLAAQSEKLRAYAGLYDLDLAWIETDAGASAKSLDRPGLRRALGCLEIGEAQGIVVAKLDRLTRSVRDLAELLDGYFGERAGFQLFSVADSIDTRTAAGRLVLNVLMSVAQWERETIVERTRDAMRHKRGKGERLGTIPYGFQLGPDGKTLAPNAGEQNALGVIDRLKREGKSLREIAATLDRFAFPSRGGGKWSTSTLAGILKRRAEQGGDHAAAG